MKFNKKDIAQIASKGIDLDQVQNQLALFKSGAPKSNLVAAATIGQGLNAIESEEQQRLITLFDKEKDEKDLIKFVPASGAATRMFKFLFEFLEAYDPDKESTNSFINKNNANLLSVFFAGAEKFPFFEMVLEETKKYHPDFETLSRDLRRLNFVKTMLAEDRLNYGSYPKGLLPFHQYNNHSSTAFSEHLFEAALYASSKGMATIHFTISPFHQEKFQEEYEKIKDIVEEKTGIQFDISFSFQAPSTDTIAVTPKDEPFRDSDDQLLFRPSGHGALLQNLDQLDADIIFIKNIDNVVVSVLEGEVSQYKKLLAGILIDRQQKVYKYLEDLNTDKLDAVEDIVQFLELELNVKMNPEFKKYSKENQKAYLIDKLNRPIRICGMVKNEGEPGGGPFWVKDKHGNISLQIVESAQIDKKKKAQKEILKNASHFNPVDIVCGVRDYKGKKFNLSEFVDHEAVFISNKTKSGKALKALELPGLWNGSMAYWNTIFVEVPLVTFNPVKTVNDLLKASHQL